MEIKNYLQTDELTPIKNWMTNAFSLRIDSPRRPDDFYWWGHKSFIKESLGSKNKIPLDVPQEIYNIKKRLVKQFSIYHAESAGDVFMFLPENCCTKRHSHTKVKGVAEIRFNILIQKPESGGKFIVENRIPESNEEDLSN